MAGRAASWWRDSPDARPIAFLAALPVLVFAIPAMTGHPAISFDNLLQNYPLRVLSGSDIRQGHLPLWNPTIWSGSPLLGGLNAGSFYPGTLLFAALPGVLAWVLNLIALYWAAGLGMYALLRQFRLRPHACLLAAVTYQFGGAMTGQLVHLGIVQGMGWMPLVLLAEIRLSWAVLGTRPMSLEPGGGAERSSPWPWVALLAALFGLIFLTGEPRSMAEAELVTPFVALWLALRSYPGAAVDVASRVRYLAYGLLAALWGTAIGAAQLLPGRTFILASQRAYENYAYFGLGSLRASWTILLLVPNLFGGNAIFGQPAFATGYNLPEVTGYVGLLPIAAFFTLAVRSIGRRSDPRARDWRPWIVLAVAGLLLSWGTFTPLGHVFAQIPFYNKVRLDSRSLGIVDLALCVAFGFFLELVLGGEWRERVKGRVQWLRERLVPAIGPASGFIAAAVALVVPGDGPRRLRRRPFRRVGRAGVDGCAGRGRARRAGGALGLAPPARHRASAPHRGRRGRPRPLRAHLLDGDVRWRSDLAVACVGRGRGRDDRPVRHRRRPEHHAAQLPLRARHQRAHRARQRPGVRVDRERHLRRPDRLALHLDDGPVRAGPRRLRAAAAPHALHRAQQSHPADRAEPQRRRAPKVRGPAAARGDIDDTRPVLREGSRHRDRADRVRPSDHLRRPDRRGGVVGRRRGAVPGRTGACGSRRPSGHPRVAAGGRRHRGAGRRAAGRRRVVGDDDRRGPLPVRRPVPGGARSSGVAPHGPVARLRAFPDQRHGPRRAGERRAGGERAPGVEHPVGDRDRRRRHALARHGDPERGLPGRLAGQGDAGGRRGHQDPPGVRGGAGPGGAGAGRALDPHLLLLARRAHLGRDRLGARRRGRPCAGGGPPAQAGARRPPSPPPGGTDSLRR